ncbi:MAG: CRISPR-associated ring nuclease, partial [Candidatus Competibacteraceae bacterium]
MDLTDYKRRILLCVTGLSPQIITETLYALVVKYAYVPTEIHLITTADGADYAKLTLLDHGQGYFYRLCTDFGLDTRKIRFDDKTVHVIP